MQNVCLVVPCYNEERRLNVAAFEQFAVACPQVSYCFVNDGSRDGTLAVLQGVQSRHPANALAMDLPANAGKAEAVRLGMLHAHGWKSFDYIGFWDADLATPLAELEVMCRLAAARPECLMVLGSRIKRLGADIDRKPKRHYLGRVFATCASLVLGLPVYDTQCGAKLLHASVVPQLFDQPFLSRWIFDVELLARLRNLVGKEKLLATTVEAPLTTWQDVGGSKLTFNHMLKAPLDLWRISRRYNRSLP